MVYYNENNKFLVAWLRNLIDAGMLPKGHVDGRSIKDVKPQDLKGFISCHFFAGLGGWPLAARMAGWPDSRAIWTGSCPCQPFSTSGRRRGRRDPRHLWPDFHRLIRAQRPDVVMGEQVAGKAGYDWLDGVRADLEGEAYATWAVDIPACSVGAPHIRNRIYWVADAQGESKRKQRDAERAKSRGEPRADASGGVPGSDGGLSDSYLQRLAERNGGERDAREERAALERSGGAAGWVGDSHGPRRRAVTQGRGEHAGEEGGRNQIPDGSGESGADHGVGHTDQGELPWESISTGREDGGEAVDPRRSDPGGGLVHPSIIGRGEGGSQHEVRRGRHPPPGSSLIFNPWLPFFLIGPDPDGFYHRTGVSDSPGPLSPIRLLDHGYPARVPILCALGNAVVVPLAVEVIRAYMDVHGIVPQAVQS